jgi:hypothetical protein
MVRKVSREKFKSDIPLKDGRTPPMLGSARVAMLQAAVNAAQRRHRVHVREVTDVDGEFSADELDSVRELQEASAAGRTPPVDDERPASYWTALQLKVLRHERRRAAAEKGAREEGTGAQPH